jgi:hypothetical protein
MLTIDTITPTCTPTAQVEILEAGHGNHHMQCSGINALSGSFEHFLKTLSGGAVSGGGFDA